MKHMETNLMQAFNDAILWNGLWNVVISYKVYKYEAALERMKSHNAEIERW